MNKPVSTELHFDVSSGLKTVLGSELITDDEVAIFELVKNSFDAEATRVDLFFDNNQIIISDNGMGMSYEDIQKKWLFVAYSAKRSVNRQDDFRDNIAERRHYAGSKGIGRFSSDRLGEIINLQTKPKSPAKSPVHSIIVDWTLFDRNHLDRFEKIGIQYQLQNNGFILPKDLPTLKLRILIKVAMISYGKVASDSHFKIAANWHHKAAAHSHFKIATVSHAK